MPFAVARLEADYGGGQACRMRVAAWTGPLIVAAALTGLALGWWWRWAWIAAALTLAIYGLGTAIATIDRAADGARVEPSLHGEPRRRASRELALRLGLRTSMALGLGLLAIATVMAAAFFDLRTLAFGAFGIFLLMLFLGWPFWVAAVSDEAARVRERTSGE